MFRPPLPTALAAVLCLAACSTDPTIPEGPATLEVVGSAEGTPGWLLDEPLAVRVTDAAGDPVEGATVAWSTGEPSAWLGAATSLSDASGTATVAFAPGWRLGTQVVSATSGGLATNLSVRVTSLALVQTTASHAPDGIRYCGITVDGALWCWLQAGIGSVRESPASLTSASYPVRVDPGVRYVQVLGDGLEEATPMCGLTDTGLLRCWSSTSLTPGTVITPVPFRQIEETVWPEVSLCGLDADGQAWCRGDNRRGQLGDGTTTDRDAFVPVQGGMRFTALFGGYASFCGLDTAHRAWCWGSGQDLVRTNTPNFLQPTRMGDDHPYVDLGFMWGGVCGLELGTGQLYCWGDTLMGDGPAAGGGTFLVPAPTGLVQLAGRSGLGLFRTNSGKFMLVGDMAEDPYVNEFVRTPREIEGMPTQVTSILSGGGNAWCVAHASGATICGSRVRRPVGVPAPR